MKALYVFLGILLLASAAQAQIPIYPYMYPQPYVYTSSDPFSQPYMGPYYYLSPFSAAAQFAAQYSNVVNPPSTAPTTQVADLQAQVRLLQDQLASVLAQTPVQQTTPAPVRLTVTEGRPGTLELVFKNGWRIESTGYAIAGNTLYYLTPFGYQRVELSNLNVAATRTENSKRGIDFRTTE